MYKNFEHFQNLYFPKNYEYVPKTKIKKIDNFSKKNYFVILKMCPKNWKMSPKKY
jgi:hypothetical protein